MISLIVIVVYYIYRYDMHDIVVMYQFFSIPIPIQQDLFSDLLRAFIQRFIFLVVFISWELALGTHV